MSRPSKRRTPFPNTGSEEIPPGATAEAADRATNPGGGAPGSGAGTRHAANDPGTPDEEYDAIDSNSPLADGSLEDLEQPREEELEAYGGFTGGAVGGTPAQKRSTGGRTGRGLAPGSSHRGDSTIGGDPARGSD